MPAAVRLDVAFSVTRSFVASPPGRAMSYSPADLEAAFAVILAALEEGEDLAPFLQQFPPGARRSLVLMLQATLPATRAASTTPPPALLRWRRRRVHRRVEVLRGRMKAGRQARRDRRFLSRARSPRLLRRPRRHRRSRRLGRFLRSGSSRRRCRRASLLGSSRHSRRRSRPSPSPRGRRWRCGSRPAT